MMRWVFWLLIIFLLAMGAALLIAANQGYVLIVRPPYRLEISLNLLMVLVVLAFILLHLALRLIHYIQRLPANVRTHRETERLKASHAALLEKLNGDSSEQGQTGEIPEKQPQAKPKA